MYIVTILGWATTMAAKVHNIYIQGFIRWHKHQNYVILLTLKFKPK